MKSLFYRFLIYTISFLIFPLFVNGQITFEKMIAPGNASSIASHNSDFYITSSDWHFLWLYKINKYGDTLLSRSYGVTGMNGGTYSGDIIITSDDNILMVGAMWPSGAQRDIYILKTNLNGDILWDTTLEAYDEVNAISVQETPDNYFVLCGTRYYGSPSDLYVVKINNSGDIIWKKSFDAYNRDSPDN
jgi:hypothetical protein